MLDLVSQVALWFNAVSGGVILVLGLFRLKPHNLMAIAVAITELLLLLQLTVAIVLVSTGQGGAGDMLEYFIYIAVALLIPPAAVLWAVVERNSKWSTVILGVVGITIAVMLVRMAQIWSGIA